MGPAHRFAIPEAAAFPTKNSARRARRIAWPAANIFIRAHKGSFEIFGEET
jgi:hypothetical protein